MTTRSTRPIAIPDVKPEVDSLFQAVVRLKEGYENHSRQRGQPMRWLVTFQDLIDMGVITQEQANEQLRRQRV